MANPANLTVTALVANAALARPPADTVDTTGTVPIDGADIDAASERLFLDVVSNGSPQTVTIKAGQNPPAVRKDVGDLAVTVNATQATLETELVGDNNDLVFTAANGGTGGNSITVTYVDPAGNDQALGVVVTDSDIVVNLATGPAGAITSTADDIAAAIAADEDAAALVTVADADGNDGSGVVTAMAEATLTGGAVAEKLLGPFEPARFLQADGDIDVAFVVAGGGFSVRTYLLPKSA
jgi:hypothetical protein